MPNDGAKCHCFDELKSLMRTHGLAGAAVESFNMHYHRLREGERGFITEGEISPVDDLPDADGLGTFRHIGISALDRVVVIKLNGGLGTGMGLDRAKSLLVVRGGLTFLDLIARQVLALRREHGARIPVALMNSFRTQVESEEVWASYPDLRIDDLPLGFQQNKVPKILVSDHRPAQSLQDSDLAWCPPGHGDLYTAIASCGLLEQLMQRGIDYAFISNADNLGAVLDPALLGYLVDREFDFLLEAANRTPADRKGGHLCRLANGRLALRDSAQCPPEAEEAFQDIERYGFFNTNNIWIYLPELARLLDEHDGFLPLPTIVNRKTFDPRDPASPPVFQLETVLGTAISLFMHSAAVRVPRTRFSPVKNTGDLLAVRSDAFELTEDFRVVLDAKRSTPPTVRLDHRYFKMIDDFERRFPAGSPSLRECDQLIIEGDVTFGADVVIRGDATIRTTTTATIPDGRVVNGDLEI